MLMFSISRRGAATTVYVWRVGVNFRGKSEKALTFVVLNFVTATSPTTRDLLCY